MKTTDRFQYLPKIRTTGIGSLPHHNSDTALEFSFKMGLPFLPQIPIRNPWEFMIAQALEGLPGLFLEESSLVSLNISVWESHSHVLDQRLREAFSQKAGRHSHHLAHPSAHHHRLEDRGFEPSATTAICWEPFLWELQERNYKIGKIQIAGPITCQWALKLQNGSSTENFPELCSQIFQLVLARAMAMTQRMISIGIQPLLYLDEPGLYALTRSNPKHVLALQELKWMIQTLRNEGAIVGLHCCSNTDWNAVFGLGLDLLSIDAGLSLKSALASGPGMETFIKQGGRLSLGVISTGPTISGGATGPSGKPSGQDPFETSEFHGNTFKNDTSKIYEDLLKTINKEHAHLQDQILSEAFFTPACGLALHSTSEVELVLDKLKDFYGHL